MKTKKDQIQVYIPMRGDIIHPAIINIIDEGAKLGEVTVGLLTDKAICQYTRPPQLNYNQRKKVIEAIRNVIKVIPQNSVDCSENILSIKPNLVLHGDDWKEGFQSSIRKKVIDILKAWNGKLHEIPYDKKTLPNIVNELSSSMGITSDKRLLTLRKLLDSKIITRIIEAHNGLTGTIAEYANYEKDGIIREFDCMWASSLTDATSRAKPDIEAVDLSLRMSTINEIFEVTTKPLIFDGDTGGKSEHLAFTIKSLERLGVSAIVIEDKKGLKKNSLLGIEVKQEQDSIENFSQKIALAKNSQNSEDFMIIARIESLILEKGMQDAINRAKAYIEYGADAILIHSRSNSPREIFNFSEQYYKKVLNKPLICVPSSYSQVKEEELISNGFKAVIYANQLLRAAYPAMQNIANTLLQNRRALEAEKKLMSIKEILELIPGTR